MIRYRLMSIDGTRATYAYEIEGKTDDAGTAILDISDGTCEVTEPAPSDEAMGYPWYGDKMRHALETFKKAGEYKESGTVSWY